MAIQKWQIVLHISCTCCYSTVWVTILHCNQNQNDHFLFFRTFATIACTFEEGDTMPISCTNHTKTKITISPIESVTTIISINSRAIGMLVSLHRYTSIGKHWSARSVELCHENLTENQCKIRVIDLFEIVCKVKNRGKNNLRQKKNYSAQRYSNNIEYQIEHLGLLNKNQHSKCILNRF